MYDIITFGSATQDIFVRSRSLKVLKNNPGEAHFETGEGICMASGSKIDVEDIEFASGGGGTNTAATFAKQGFRVAYCGSIGVDAAGLEIVRELKMLKVDTKFLQKKKEKHTNHSVVLLSNGDRSIMVYRGASELLKKEDLNFNKLKKSRWFYLAPLGEGLIDMFEELVSFAKENNIRVALNPSKQQLSLPLEILQSVFSKTDVLFLNNEEAAFLAKLPIENEKEILAKICSMCPGLVVITKGGDGVVVCDGKNSYSAKPNAGRQIVDTTGAGDSFASGFLSDYIRQDGDIEKAIQLGMANSEGNLKLLGAKTGLLSRDEGFSRVPVIKQ